MGNSSSYNAEASDRGRLDRYLAVKNICPSRSVAVRWITEERVLVNGNPERPAYQVCAGDCIQVTPPQLKLSELTPHEVDFGILHEDKDIIVINKPAGIVVHPGAGNYDTSLVHGLLHRCEDLSGIGGVERPGIVHRLDKGTTGVMVVAKNDRAHASLTEQFQNRVVKKAYFALVVGKVIQEDQLLQNLMKRAEFNRKKFVVNQKKGKSAVTRIQVIHRDKRASLVRALPETGRTHQIRVHLSFIGHPILGDDTYGCTLKKLAMMGVEDREFVRSLTRPLLHAHRLNLIHPGTKKNMEFCAPMPDDMRRALAHFWPDWQIPQGY